MHQSHIPQCTILLQKCAHGCTFLLQNVASWDICLMHCGMCERGLLYFVSFSVIHCVMYAYVTWSIHISGQDPEAPSFRGRGVSPRLRDRGSWQDRLWNDRLRTLCIRDHQGKSLSFMKKTSTFTFSVQRNDRKCKYILRKHDIDGLVQHW